MRDPGPFLGLPPQAFELFDRVDTFAPAGLVPVGCAAADPPAGVPAPAGSRHARVLVVCLAALSGLVLLPVGLRAAGVPVAVNVNLEVGLLLFLAMAWAGQVGG